jgi:hypothetical protein
MGVQFLHNADGKRSTPVPIPQAILQIKGFSGMSWFEDWTEGNEENEDWGDKPSTNELWRRQLADILRRPARLSFVTFVAFCVPRVIRNESTFSVLVPAGAFDSSSATRFRGGRVRTMFCVALKPCIT